MGSGSSKARRWVIASVILVLTIAVVAVGAFHLALRPPISDTQIEEITTRLEALAHREPIPAGQDVTTPIQNIIADMRKALAAWEVENEDTLVDLANAPTSRAGDLVWEGLESTFEPVIEGLGKLPPRGRIPRYDINLPRPIRIQEVQEITKVVQALGQSYALHDRQAKLVPLANRFLSLVVVREDDTLIGALVASRVVLDAVPLMAEGIPLATKAQLLRAQDQLRHASVSIAEFDRAIAQEAVGTVKTIRMAVADPTIVDYIDTPASIHQTAAYLKFQLALTAKRWNEFFDLPRSDWNALATATDLFAREIRRENDDWRTGLANSVWVEFSSIVRTLAEQQATTVALRVAVAAELHRREHGSYPSDLASLDRFIDPTHGWITGPEAITIESTARRCRVALSAPNTPATGVVLEAPE
ncbi:MAG: hypothetical protein AAF488_00035 [Planctomycetota bacterium]